MESESDIDKAGILYRQARERAQRCDTPGTLIRVRWDESQSTHVWDVVHDTGEVIATNLTYCAACSLATRDMDMAYLLAKYYKKWE